MHKLKIGKHIYTVHMANYAICNRAHIWGLFEGGEKRISIKEDLCGADLVDTFWHEIFHAFSYEYRWRAKVSEEQHCQRQGEAMALFIGHNRDFMKFMLTIR